MIINKSFLLCWLTNYGLTRLPVEQYIPQYAASQHIASDRQRLSKFPTIPQSSQNTTLSVLCVCVPLRSGLPVFGLPVGSCNGNEYLFLQFHRADESKHKTFES